MPAAIEVHEPEVNNGITLDDAIRPIPKPELFRPSAPERLLFTECLLDSYKTKRNRRKSATIFSFMLQCLLIGTLMIVPLMFSEALPKQQLLTFLVAPPPPPAVAAVKVVRVVQSDLLSSGHLRTLSRILEKVQMIREEEGPPPLTSIGGVVGGVPGGVPGGQLGGLIGGIISQTATLNVVPKLTAPTDLQARARVTGRK